MTQIVSHAGIPLRELQVRTIRPDEEESWNVLMLQRHYLGFRNFCGNRLRQAWVAPISWF